MMRYELLMALIVLFVAFFLPFHARSLRQNAAILSAYWFVIILHQAVAFINAFWFTTLGADTDATTFHLIGVELARSWEFSFSIGSKFYENMLGVIYALLGTSHFLGEQLSILAFAISCVYLLKIVRALNFSRYAAVILVAFGALPTMVLFGSITLRESYQTLFFMLAVYLGMKMHLKGGVNIYLAGMVLSAFVMGLFHKGLVIYAFFLIAVFMFWSVRPATSVWRVRKLRALIVIALPVLVVVASGLARMGVPGTEFLAAMLDLDILEATARYRDRAVEARATYGVALDLSSPLMTAYSSIVLYLHYLFSPFPWQVRNVMDIYAAMESMLRLVLIYYSFKSWRNSRGVTRGFLGLMLLLYFSMTFLWAAGTTNYGTAMRHHMLSWWLIVVAGLPSLMTAFSRIRLGSMLRGRPCDLGRAEMAS